MSRSAQILTPEQIRERRIELDKNRVALDQKVEELIRQCEHKNTDYLEDDADSDNPRCKDCGAYLNHSCN